LVAREAQGKTFFRGRGCYECGGTGFKGRVALYEILMLSQRIREYIANEATEAIIRQLALTEGLVTLNYAGTQAVLNGTTSVSGLLHVSQSDEDFGSRCPACESVIDPEFVACPHCTRKLIDTCAGCGKIIDPAWCCCPYCSNKVREPAKINQKRKIRKAS
jgi:type IV pilus assembly protein PilB